MKRLIILFLFCITLFGCSTDSDDSSTLSDPDNIKSLNNKVDSDFEHKTDYFVRQGTGTGIIGTWVCDYGDEVRSIIVSDSGTITYRYTSESRETKKSYSFSLVKLNNSYCFKISKSKGNYSTYPYIVSDSYFDFAENSPF